MDDLLKLVARVTVIEVKSTGVLAANRGSGPLTSQGYGLDATNRVVSSSTPAL